MDEAFSKIIYPQYDPFSTFFRVILLPFAILYVEEGTHGAQGEELI